jgi:hypothetical protein
MFSVLLAALSDIVPGSDLRNGLDDVLGPPDKNLKPEEIHTRWLSFLRHFKDANQRHEIYTRHEIATPEKTMTPAKVKSDFEKTSNFVHSVVSACG